MKNTIQKTRNFINDYAYETIGSFARLLFAFTLLPFFFRSAITKFADGFPVPSDGAYIQILPLAFEAAGYNSSNMDVLAHLVVYIGSYTEFLLPLCVVIGVYSRLSALSMIGFIFVMTLTDIFGHHAQLGSFIGANPQESILIQRAMWTFLLCVIVAFGGGYLSVDSLLCKKDTRKHND